ncbi:MAG: ATP-binding protein, partial [Anaerolineae bacterium]
MWRDILQRGPGQILALMEELDAQELAETMVAFANADGGTIVIGVDESGRSTGEVFPDEVESIVQEAVLAGRPPVQMEWNQEEIAGGFAFFIRIPRSTELHSLADGRVLIRTSNENRPLSGEEIRQLAATKSTGDYETEVLPGATREDLDDQMIEKFVELWEERRGREWTRSKDDLLTQVSALTPEGQPTVMGVLLFGRDPQRFLPQSGLVFVKFPGTSPRGENGLAGYGRREEIMGPLAQIIERAWSVIMEEMQTGAVVKGLKREEQTEYPRRAIREALINAVAHRDYRLGGRRIEVRMFSDRMEVISPGGLPGYITLDNIVDEHFSRNPRIVSGLFQWGYIEELGLGVDLMIDEMTAAGHPPP